MVRLVAEVMFKPIPKNNTVRVRNVNQIAVFMTWKFLNPLKPEGVQKQPDNFVEIIMAKA